MKNDKTHLPIGTITVRAAENLPANRLVTSDGKLCSANQTPLGATTKTYSIGQLAAVCFAGVVPIECDGNVPIATTVAPADNGKITVANGTTGQMLSLDSGTTGQFVRVKL